MLILMTTAMLTELLTMTVKAPEEPLSPGEEGEIEIVLNVAEPWYIYAPTGLNEAQGMSETTIEMRHSDAAQFRPAVFPKAVSYGVSEVFLGDGITLKQPLRIRSSAAAGEATIRGDVFYQLCKPDMCLPPDSASIKVRLEIKR